MKDLAECTFKPNLSKDKIQYDSKGPSFKKGTMEFMQRQ